MDGLSPVSSSLMMSSLRLVPPVVTMTRVFMCLPRSLQSWEVCRASSRVGSITIAEGEAGGGEGRCTCIREYSITVLDLHNLKPRPAQQVCGKTLPAGYPDCLLALLLPGSPHCLPAILLPGSPDCLPAILQPGSPDCLPAILQPGSPDCLKLNRQFVHLTALPCTYHGQHSCTHRDCGAVCRQHSCTHRELPCGAVCGLLWKCKAVVSMAAFVCKHITLHVHYTRHVPRLPHQACATPPTLICTATRNSFTETGDEDKKSWLT